MPDLQPRQFYTQGRLFDPGPSDEGVPSVRNLLAQGQWHGTDVENWTQRVRSAGVPVHSGTIQAAQGRGSDLYPVLPRNRMDPSTGFDLYPDDEANFAETRYARKHGLPASHTSLTSGARYAERWRDEHPGDTRSASDVPTEGVEDLDAGFSIAYRNEAEDVGSVSYISPPGGFSTVDDADLGLAAGTGWRPSPRITQQELRQQAPELVVPPDAQRATRDPRLFEEVDVRGESGYYHHSDVSPRARRFKENHGRLLVDDLHNDLKLGAQPF